MAVTVGTDSYVDLDYAESYAGKALRYEEWAPYLRQESALKFATILLDTRVRWYGRKTDPAQTLQWPRKGLLDRYGNAVDSSTVPEIIKQTQCELAFSMMEKNPMLVESGIEQMDLDGLVLDLKAGRQTIPYKIFSPLSIWGELLDGAPAVRLTR